VEVVVAVIKSIVLRIHRNARVAAVVVTADR
jgi:hypothetical protein